jgi:predicted MFS family arabinose efflux permease
MMASGLIFLGAGFLLLAQLTGDSGYWAFLAGVMPFGIGMALSSTPATTAIVGSLPRSKQGVASAMNDTTREVGSALGIALLGSAFNSAYSGHIASQLAGAPSLPAGVLHGVTESPGVGMNVAHQLGGADGARLGALVKDSFAAGLSHALWIGMIVIAVGLAFVFARAPRRVEQALELEPVEVWEAELAPV